MAQLTFTVPDALVPRVVAALLFAYPDLEGTQAQVAKAGVRRLIADQLARAEARAAELAGYDAMVASAETARQQAAVDAAGIQ